MIRLSIHLFTILTTIIQMSLKYKKIFSEFFGVGVGVPKKILSESESESESRKKKFSGVGVGIGIEKVDSAVHYFR